LIAGLPIELGYRSTGNSDRVGNRLTKGVPGYRGPNDLPKLRHRIHTLQHQRITGPPLHEPSSRIMDLLAEPLLKIEVLLSQ
jgi:hypothetical protein